MFLRLVLWWALWRQPPAQVPTASEPDPEELGDEILGEHLWRAYLEQCWLLESHQKR